MTAEKEYFIYLLSCFLSGESPKGRRVDWEEIYRLADIHDVGAVISQEIKYLPDEYKPQGTLASHFIQVIGFTIREYESRNRAFLFIKRLLDKNDVDHIFVKGIVVKDFYPIPEMRTSGDIDVIVRTEEFDRVVKLIKSVGIKIITYTTEVITVDAGGVEIEIHKEADVGSHYFDDIFSLCRIADGHTYAFNNTDHLLYIICHLAKHLAYTGAGIRMLMDIDVMVRNLENFNQAEFLRLCDTAGIKKSGEALLSLSAFWLHTPIVPNVDYSEETALLERFENVMLNGGSFGYETSAIPVKYFETVSNRDGDLCFVDRAKIILKMAFPDKEYLRKCYPYYKKNSHLYIVARINRVIDGLFKKRSLVKKAFSQVNSDSEISAYQKELIKELEINN